MLRHVCLISLQSRCIDSSVLSQASNLPKKRYTYIDAAMQTGQGMYESNSFLETVNADAVST